ncbi:MAG: ATP-grasp domain-containing protein, partial [Brevinema sp.]
MSYSEKSFVVIGAGELQIPLIQAAKKLGLTVIASDKSPQAPGFQYADISIIADTMNPQETLEQLIEYTEKNGVFHGIATSGTDASLTVAVVAEYFGLPGHHPEAVLCATNKGLMRKMLEQHHVPIPQYKLIATFEEASNFFEQIQSPCVLKPINNMGARGVSLVSHIEELPKAFALAQEYSRDTSEILIEEYLDAHELSIDALVHNGMITITGIADRIIEYPPYFVETGHILPSGLGEDWIERAILTFRDGIKALRLSHGAAKIDLKISKTETWIIEIAARLSGGFMSSHTFPLATGIALHEYMVKLALGEDIAELIPNKNLVSVERAIILPPGIIQKITIPEDILEQQYISHFVFRAKEGDLVHSPKNNLDKQGSIIATAPTRELALRAINQALLSIKITVEDQRNYPKILQKSDMNAKYLLQGVCNICKACDGVWCRGNIPGVGGVGTGEGFIQAYDRFRQIKLIPHYIHEVRSVDSSIQMFGVECSMPVFVAPIGGAKVNYNNACSELDLQRAFLKGAKH